MIGFWLFFLVALNWAAFAVWNEIEMAARPYLPRHYRIATVVLGLLAIINICIAFQSAGLFGSAASITIVGG